MFGDCLKRMREIETGSVDMILCDLPYGIKHWGKNKSGMGWDEIIPFKKLWKQYWRVLKNHGAIVLFGTEPFSTQLRTSQLRYFKYDYIWKKNKVSGFMAAKCKPLKSYELISVFSQGTTAPGGKNNMFYFPQGLIRVDKKVKGKRKSDSIGIQGSRLKHDYVQTFTNYPKDILEFESESGLHPTQKPVPLLKYLIRTYTRKGETVLDNTMGSGSTGVAAIETRRNFIGIEKKPEFFKIACKRIKKAKR
jgi:site-specific DNA-methyltransferase (adenine-specific)